MSPQLAPAAPSRLPRLLKHGLRTGVDHVARVSGMLARRERGRASELTVLMYHRVLPEARCSDYPFASLAMPRGAFAAQVRWLVAHGEVLTLAAALAREGGRGRRPLFALTFDDGYDDAGAGVAEVLEDAGVRGTFFVSTGFVGTDRLLWFDRAALLFAAVPEPVRHGIVAQVCGEQRLDERPRGAADGASWTRYLKGCRPAERAAILSSLQLAAGGPPPTDGFRALSVERLVELHRNGHEIGSHTVSHAMLPELDEQTLRVELEDARAAIASWIGAGVPGFCYPNGDHDERTVAAVVRTGHAYACTTRGGLHAAGGDPYRIRRVGIDPARVIDGAQRLDLTAFRRELCGLYRRGG